ncbi:MAG: HAD family hydrolase [Paracoccaceae bacterium]
MASTRPYIPRVGVVFDFDKTLASDTIDGMLGVLGLARDEWEARYQEPLGEGWHPIIRRGQALIRAGRDLGRPLTRERFAEAGRHIALYPGVLEMPGRLREVARAVDPTIDVEISILSSGFVELIRATEMADRVDHVFAGGFHFEGDGPEGEAVCVKQIISHPEKALYLRAYGEGLDVSAANAPGTAGPLVAERDFHILYDQMVYLGDGESDLQAFGFLESEGGLTIAIEDGERFDDEDAMAPGQQVDTLAPADYREGRPIMEALEMAVRACASRVALRRWSAGKDRAREG